MTRINALPPYILTVLTLLRNAAIAAAAVGAGLAVGLVISGEATWPVTLLGLAFYALVIVTHPLAGLLLMAVTAPFSRFWYLDLVMGRGIPDLTLTRICAGLLMAIVVAQLSIGKIKPPRLTWLDGAVLATLLGIGVSLPAAMGGLKAAITGYGDAYLVPAIVYALARVLVRERKQAEYVCTAFIILGAVLTTVAVHEQLSGTVLFVYSERSWVYAKGIHKLAGLLGSPAFFAALIGMSSAFTAYRLAHAHTAPAGLLYGALLAYTAVGVYFTYNRAGYISLAAALLLAALAWPRFRRVFAVAAVAGAAVLVMSWSTVMQSAVVTERLSASGPVEYRMEIWGNAARILAHNPLLGLGYGNFGQVYLSYNPSWEYATVLPAPHNSVLEVAFNSGLLGVAPYLASACLIALGIARFRRAGGAARDVALATAFAICLVPYAVEAMVVDMVSAYYVNMVMMLSVGALFGWQMERQATADTGQAEVFYARGDTRTVPA